MADLTSTTLDSNGTPLLNPQAAATVADAGTVDRFALDSQTIVIAYNTALSSENVTVKSVTDPFGRVDPEAPVVVPAEGSAILGPYSGTSWAIKGGVNQGKVELQHSGAATLSFLVLRVPRVS